MSKRARECTQSTIRALDRNPTRRLPKNVNGYNSTFTCDIPALNNSIPGPGTGALNTLDRMAIEDARRAAGVQQESALLLHEESTGAARMTEQAPATDQWQGRD